MKALLASILMFASPMAFAATMSLDSLVTLLIYIVVLALIFWLIWWFIGYVGLPEPFNKVARVLIGLLAFVLMLYLLIGILPAFPGR